jgi:hypothetical protein
MTADPAEPMSQSKAPPFIRLPGLKMTSLAPTAAPSNRPPQTCAAASSTFRCCGLNPGLSLFALILVTLTGLADRTEKDTASLMMVPEPDFSLPSILFIQAVPRKTPLGRRALGDTSLLESLEAGITFENTAAHQV